MSQTTISARLNPIVPPSAKALSVSKQQGRLPLRGSLGGLGVRSESPSCSLAGGVAFQSDCKADCSLPFSAFFDAFAVAPIGLKL